MQKIENVSNPEVGKFYLVYYGWYDNKTWIPLIPNEHIDKGFAPHIPAHYHLDQRFDCVQNNGQKGFYGATNLAFNAENFSKFEYKRRKLKHIWRGALKNPEEHKAYRDFFDNYIGASCKGQICPHKKARMIMVDGKWICPMHNLVGCPKTEKIVGYGHTPYYERVNTPHPLPEGWAVIVDRSLGEFDRRYIPVKNGKMCMRGWDNTIIGICYSIDRFYHLWKDSDFVEIKDVIH